MSKPKEIKTLETIIDRDVPFEKRAEAKKFLKKLMGESVSSKGAISDKEMKAFKDAAKGSGIAGGGVKGASEAVTPQKKRSGGGMMMRAKGYAKGGAGKMKTKGYAKGGAGKKEDAMQVMIAVGKPKAGMMKAKGKAAGGAMNGMMMRAKGKAAGGAMKSKAKSSPVRAPSSKNSGLYGR